ncbi:MAG: hypothetical protein FJ137_01450 [Deltaproteobacteria bacterium]|nr:hypothetical protein [Deltaproteobacteria bacterium]
MSLLSRLAGLPASLKDSWKKTFGDVDVPLDDASDAAAAVAARPAMAVAQAWGVVGVPASATLDDVRAAARARGAALHARVVAQDADAAPALEQLVTASELLEEHLLPALRGSAPSASALSTTAGATPAAAPSPPRSGRVRATPRAP